MHIVFLVIEKYSIWWFNQNAIWGGKCEMKIKGSRSYISTDIINKYVNKGAKFAKQLPELTWYKKSNQYTREEWLICVTKH